MFSADFDYDDYEFDEHSPEERISSIPAFLPADGFSTPLKSTNFGNSINNWISSLPIASASPNKSLRFDLSKYGTEAEDISRISNNTRDSSQVVLQRTKKDDTHLLEFNKSFKSVVNDILNDKGIRERLQMVQNEADLAYYAPNFSNIVQRKSQDAANALSSSNQQFETKAKDWNSKFQDYVYDKEKQDHEETKAQYSRLDQEYKHVKKQIIENISSRLSARDNETKMIVAKLQKIKNEKIEREKQRQLEIERQRKEEEEKQRKAEEAERKRREEEAERKRKEEEERKRQAEEEAKRQRIIAEKKAGEERKKAEEERKKAEEEKKQKEANAAQEAQKKAVERQNNDMAFSSQSKIETKLLKYWETCLNYRVNVKEEMKKPENKNLKNLTSKLKRRLNPKLGQLTNSISKLNEITLEVIQIIEEAQTIASPNFNDPANILAYKWILYIFTKLIISQAESEVAVSSKSGLPLSRLAVYVLVRYPHLKEILFAKFMKKCPFILGYTCSIDTVEGRIRMGWKYTNKNSVNKTFEAETNYAERLGGIFTLWSLMSTVKLGDNQAVVARLGVPQQQLVQPLGISKSWIMVSRLLNVDRPLITNAHFYLLCNWVQAAATQFLQAYGNQGSKLLVYLFTDYTQGFTGKDFTAAVKLIALGEEWRNTGKLGSLDPMEP